MGYYDNKRMDMLRFIPRSAKKLLDLGCANGYFGETLKKQFGMEVWGIELNPEVAENARERLDKVIVGNIESGEIILPNKYFDCIVCNDLLEHLRDPWTVLTNLRAYISDGGCLVASIPNVRYYRNMMNLIIHKQWKYEDVGILDISHLRFFTKSSIDELFTRSGYRIVRKEGISAATGKFSLVSKLWPAMLDDMRYMQFACVAQPYADL